jgi:hypothetical protein
LQVRNLSVFHYANGMTHWGYGPSAHTCADILEAGYFEGVRDLLAVGDWIFVSASDGPLVLWVRGNEIGCTVERVR